MNLFFRYGSFIILCFLVIVQGFGQKETQPQRTTASASDASINPFIITEGSGIFDLVADREKGQASNICLYPASSKYHIHIPHLNQNFSSNRNTGLSSYVFIALYQIIRLDGPDIIHPFNYFW